MHTLISNEILSQDDFKSKMGITLMDICRVNIIVIFFLHYLDDVNSNSVVRFDLFMAINNTDM